MEAVIMLGFLMILSVEDIRWKEVHSILLYAFLTSGIVVWFIRGQVTFYEFAGGIACGGMLWIISQIMPEKLGNADGIVFAATGAYLGLLHNLFLMMVSMILAGLGSLVAVVILRRSGDDTMPLIPYIAAGQAVIMIMEGR